MVAKRKQWSAASIVIAPPDDHDAFLADSILHCLVKGCHWRGHNLGIHVTRTHELSARDFKMAAGFNLLAGLVSATARERYRQAALERDAIAHAMPHRPPQHVLAAAGAVGRRAYRSAQGKVHLYQRDQPMRDRPVPVWRRCAQCGKQFKRQRARFCSSLCQRRASEARRPQRRSSRAAWLREWRAQHPDRVRVHLHRQWLKKKQAKMQSSVSVKRQRKPVRERRRKLRRQRRLRQRKPVAVSPA